jgi:SAM-dependent methyltransferase
VAEQQDTFYKSFSEKKLTGYGSGRRSRIEQHRLALLHRFKPAPGDMVEVGPGHGTLAEQAVTAGWRYTAIEASRILIDVLRGKGLAVIESWAPPIPVPDASVDVVYADQVLEHMNGIEQARQFTAEALRVLRPGGVLYVVVPDYLKERTFLDVLQTRHDRTPRASCSTTEASRCTSSAIRPRFSRDALAAAALLVNIWRGCALAPHRTAPTELLQDPQELFETLTFVARKLRGR